MDTIVEFCSERQLRAGYFAVLYRFVTIRIKEEIEAGNFDDNERIEQLDTLFAQRFFDAFDGYYNNNESVTKSWLHAFESADSGKHLIMQHLLLGINAHINLDLGIAAAETMKEGNLEDIHADYDKINAILGSLIEDVRANISAVSPLFGALISLAKGRDEMLLNFSIITARDGAWRFAKSYAAHPNKHEAIKKRDQKIYKLACRIIDTGKWLSFLIRIIRFGEYRSPSENMRILSGIPG